MMKIGIDKIGFYTPSYYVDMEELAEARGVEPAKLTIGIGQSKMAVPPITQDPVTMAANAAAQMLSDEDKQAIDFVIVGTESGIDQSKATAVYVHDLLDINPYARSIEMKEACYGGTVGLQTAVNHIARHPESKVLVLASDVARYGLNTAGETTQGAGAVAMLVSADPSIAVVNDNSTFYTGDIMDFWRPNYSETAKVESKYSNEQYLVFLDKVWTRHKEQFKTSLNDLKAICFHLPYTKMGLKGLRQMLPEVSEAKQEELTAIFDDSRLYSRYVGNIYTGSLYLSLISLLDQAKSLSAGDEVGMYSYGSGAVAEFFTVTLVEGYEAQLQTEYHEALLNNRQQVTVAEYEDMFETTLPTDGSQKMLTVDANEHAQFNLVGIQDHQRLYK